MDLTSWTTVYALAALAALFVALLVWQWPRLGRPGWAWVTARLVSIGVTQLVTTTMLFAAVNADYQFYGSWGELFGTGTTAPAALTGTNSSGGTTDVNSHTKLIQPGDSSLLNRVTGIPAGPAAVNGRVESVRVIGRRTGVIDPAFVYLPPQYFQKAYHRQRFPVIVAMSGYPGSIFNLAQNLRVWQTSQDLMKQGKMQPTIIVEIRPTIAPPRDTECVNVPGGPQTETFLAKDLPDALKSGYRVGHSATAWGALGYSSGGTCALQLALRDPNAYTSAAALSPDFRIKEDLTTGNLFGSGLSRQKRIDSHDLFWRLKHLPIPQVSVLIAASKHGDENIYPQAQEFLRLAKAPLRTASIFPDKGVHNFNTWTSEMPAALAWQSQQLIFPQDVVPRHLKHKGTKSAVRAGGEPSPTPSEHRQKR
ncbi:alpha/beta hydrolase-fold protein [Streptomyces coacervatus]|uniref:Alpha/beta hydrolase-fold protein n=1 Tax=Streptomyces coacervatus TaxID=647381 RepID=A0ABP7I454_9ACTN|nr:alpha/beta hydrolase-fold protein [Streptomyces coacervatus]MDF2269538.1 alpha/beta hydrolase-fold protein [Streptomyces coacervatus]